MELFMVKVESKKTHFIVRTEMCNYSSSPQTFPIQLTFFFQLYHPLVHFPPNGKKYLSDKNYYHVSCTWYQRFTNYLVNLINVKSHQKNQKCVKFILIALVIQMATSAKFLKHIDILKCVKLQYRFVMKPRVEKLSHLLVL